MTEMPDEYLTEVLPVVKKIAAASGAENWNLLQNNGRLAHQEVDHVSTVFSIPGYCGGLCLWADWRSGVAGEGRGQLLEVGTG